MTCLFRRTMASLATLLVAAHAHAYEAGWMQIQTAGATPDAPKTTVALFYPTMAAPRVIAMGPFALEVAIGGKPVDKVKALILLSHGNAGTELGHSVLAQALARNGYLVAALRHPGDNWQDRSLLETSPERYFDERPRQASRVIDAILADPAWKARIATDSQGSRVGALGHSAGRYTVLAWQAPDRICPARQSTAFAFMDTPSMSLPSPDGDVAANPPGFDRDAFLKQLAVEITAFFDKNLM
jgi:predicted dienelactone hydrolase